MSDFPSDRHDRLQTILDEAFGPFPSMTVDELLSQLEHELFKQRQQAEAARGLVAALERAHACPTVRNDGTCDGCHVSEALALARANVGGAAGKVA